MKLLKIIGILFVCLVLFLNFFPPFQIGVGIMAFRHYTSSEGEFTYNAFPGEDMESTLDSFAVFKQEHPEYTNTLLYRIDKRHWGRFWEMVQLLNGTVLDKSSIY